MFSLTDRHLRGGHSAGHHQRGDLWRHDGSRGRIRQARLPSAWSSEAQDYVAPRGRQGDHRPQWFAPENQR